jgi:UPF0755 protein
MSRRKRSRLIPGLLLIFVLLCLVSTGLVVAIPSEANAIYGPPVTTLSYLDRLSLSLKLLMNQEVLIDAVYPGGDPVSISIESGEPVVEIAARMEATGLIDDADAWVAYLVYSGLDTQLQAGSYRLSPALSPVGIARYMQDPRSHEIFFSILPGWRLEEIAASLPSSGLAITPEDFLTITSSTGVSNLDGRLPAALSSLEGYLMPGDYTITHGATITELLPLILGHFFGMVDGDLIQAYTGQGLNLEQAVILASVAEREAIVDDEMPLIASVFLNRLASGMSLESDPTVQYAVGYDNLSASWWKVPLDSGDLSINSPYNTYLYNGLPPGPICNPGAQALQAIAHPEYSRYLFFRAACDGSGRHNFSETYSEHLDKGCE